ncbi:hypothetical protein [Pseudomonas sp. RGM 3321]|uniref:hypothetical protein n=1 Tax=Pseudomonas sp. RGM 3321 TaxID=2930089 RepID=UPI001FCC94A2|nr:hypothetical protein [Pseudomonas sp. RGM 3321]MCJ2371253.1 hypothetical protein [Pseudomonas sp. RGM 3321]
MRKNRQYDDINLMVLPIDYWVLAFFISRVWPIHGSFLSSCAVEKTLRGKSGALTVIDSL